MEFAQKIFGGENAERKANFPICFPLFHHDIKKDCEGKIHMGLMNIVLYFGTVGLLVVNALVGILSFIAMITLKSNLAGGYLSLVLISIFICVVSPVAAFFCQYLPAYGAARGHSSLRYILFFIFATITFIFFVVMFFGVPYIGGSGIVSAIFMLIGALKSDENKAFAFIVLAINLVVSLLWIVLIVLICVMIGLYGYYFKKDNPRMISTMTKGRALAAGIGASV